MTPATSEAEAAALARARAAWGGRVPPSELFADWPLLDTHPCACCGEEFGPSPEGLRPCGGCGDWHFVCYPCASQYSLDALVVGQSVFSTNLPLIICPDNLTVAQALMGEPKSRRAPTDNTVDMAFLSRPLRDAADPPFLLA